MAKKKYYAVREGAKTGIFETWAECSAVVKGYSGAKYKSFLTLEEAENYLKEDPAFRNTDVDPEKDVIAFVDGSYNAASGIYGYGCLFLKPDGTQEEKSGTGNEPGAAAIRNVAGEMLGAQEAVLWAIDREYATIELRYDYEGIENWASGAWEAKNPFTRQYAARMRELSGQIGISFRKVAAHSGNRLNDRVDALAKKAVGIL